MKFFVSLTVIFSVTTLAAGFTKEQCGSLATLAGHNPSVDGFLVGEYADGYAIYAGQGDFSQCYNQNPAAARIQTTSNAGAYSSCGWASGGELYRTAAQYFLNHADLQWYPTMTSQVGSVPGAIKIGDKYLGRVNVSRSSGSYSQVAKVDSNGMFYVVVGEGEKYMEGDVEILACIHCDNGGKGPFCCTNGANNRGCKLASDCGGTLDMSSNDPAASGLLAGKYIDGTPIYPGLGSFSDCGQDPGIARIQVGGAAGTGAHSTCGSANGGELHNAYNAKFFSSNADLKWYPTQTWNVDSVPGAIEVGDKFIGRVNITTSSGSYSQIAKVQSYGMWYVIEGQGEVYVEGDVEILTCKPSATTTTTPITTTTTPTTTTTSTTTTTTTTPTTTITPASVCARTKDILDSSGSYIKTACLIVRDANYTASSAYCQSKAMRLYAISTSDEYSGLQSWATSVFKTGTGSEMWVGGELVNGVWITSNGQPLHSSAFPIKDIGFGNCLKDSNLLGSFNVAARPCRLASWSFCEYVNVTKTTLPSPPACGTYVSFNVTTDFDLVAKNGIDPLGNSQYLGSVNYTAPSGCADSNPHFTILSNTTTENTTLCSDKTHATSFKYLLNSSRYQWIPVISNQTDPCLTPGAVKFYNYCYGKSVDGNGTTEFGTFQQDLKHVYGLFVFRNRVVTFIYENTQILTCN